MTDHQPRIRRNDYGVLHPPGVGAWEPRRSVSVIVPAHGDQAKLDLTLAALAAQSYPAHLTEVLVVDDGSDPPLRLPEITPENTRLVFSDPAGWGPGHAIHSGTQLASGEIVQRVDADMVLWREHLEALMRWHHLADYLVTIGYKRFIELPTPLPAPASVHKAVLAGTADALFDLAAGTPSSTEKVIEETDGLRATTSHRAYNVVTGPTLSMSRRMYDLAGGFDGSLAAGEDTEFGYRLAVAGAVFIPEPVAQAVHLGIPSMRGRRAEAFRFTEPYYTQRIPLRRDLRSKHPAGQWAVPYVEVVVDVSGASLAEVRATAAAVLGGAPSDVRLALAAPWSSLKDERRAVLDDPDLELRLIRETFGHDARVRLVDTVPESSAPVPYRFVCPAGWAGSLEPLVAEAEGSGHGVVIFPDGSRLERTAAMSRASLLRKEGEDLDDVVNETYGLRSVPDHDNRSEPEAVKPAGRLSRILRRAK